MTSPVNSMVARILTYIRYSLRIRRVEYRVAEIPIYLIPVFLIVREKSAFTSATFWEGFFIFFFLFAFGDLLNCLSDRDLDAIDKPYLTEAVHGIGVRGVAFQAAASAFFALALTIHLAVQNQNWILIPTILAGLFVAYAYSMEPIRLKKRGLGQLLFYWVGLFFGPMIFAALLFESPPPLPVVLVSLFYGLMQTGVILVNTSEDLPEDRNMGVRTVTVALGLQRTMGLAWMLTLVGGSCLVLCLGVFSLRVQERPLMTLALIPLMIAVIYAMSCIGKIFGKVSSLDEKEGIVVVKSYGKLVPVWMTSTAVSTLIAAVSCFKVQ